MTPSSFRSAWRAWVALPAVPVLAVVLAWTVAVGLGVGASQARAASFEPMNIGVIGAGNIGGTLASLWIRAGHRVMLSSRHPERLRGLAERLGPLAWPKKRKPTESSRRR